MTRALVYDRHGGISVMRATEVTPPTPAEDEVLIQVQAASLNPFDWKLRRGALRTFFHPEFPITPGRDGAGVIVAMGRSANLNRTHPLRVGQPVCFISSHLSRGAMAGMVRVKALGFVADAPKHMDVLEYAALPLVGLSAWNAMHTAGLESGMKILIHGGSGGVGSAAIQIANHLGAEVYATCSATKMERVHRLGATPIAYDQVDFTDVISGCDVVFDTVGGKVHESSYQVLKRGGCLVYLNAAPFQDLSDSFEVQIRQAMILGQTTNLANVMALACEGKLRSPDVVPFAFADFADAFALAESGRPAGKTVLSLQSKTSAASPDTPNEIKEQP